MSIHQNAVESLGPAERIAKLRRELSEALTEVNQLEEGKSTPDKIIHELFDVLFVAMSLPHIPGFEGYNVREQVRHDIEAERKLRIAIEAHHIVTEGDAS